MTIAIATLILTIVVETGLALLIARSPLVRVPAKRLWIDTPLINLASHPIATLLFRSGIVSFATAEWMVFAVEVVLYRTVTRASWAQAIVLSAILNGATVLLALSLAG